MYWTTTRRPRKSRIPSRNHSPAPCFNSLRFMGVPAVAVNITAGKFGLLGLPVGFQTRPSGWDCGTPIQWGYALDHFRLLTVGGLARGNAPACIAASVPRPKATPSFLWKTSKKLQSTSVKGQLQTLASVSGNPTPEQTRVGKSHSQSSVLTPDDVLVGSQCKDAGRWPFRCPELSWPTSAL